jgi:hypothetical protein
VPENAKVISGAPLGADKTRWQGELKLIPGSKVVTVSARFVNRAGLDRFETKSIDLAALGGGAGNAKTGTIKVTVNDLAPRAQPDVEVLVMDKEGKKELLPKGKTNEKGEYVFKEVPPGEYRISVTVDKSGRILKGEASVKVEAGKVAPADIVIK